MRFPSVSRNLRTAILVGAIAALANGLIWIHGFCGGFSKLELHEADQMVYTSLARNLANGQGFVDSCIYPVSLSVVQRIPHPYLRGTLFPMMLVPFFVLFGARDLWAIVPVWCCYGLLVAAAFLMARRVLSLRSSLLACVLVATNPVVIRLSVRCLPDLPGSLAVVLLLLALEMNARPLVLGLVFAIVCCLKPTFATLLPLVLWGACDEKSWKARLTAALYVGFGSLLIIWPWMLRNFLITRNPFYSFLGYDLLSHTPSFRNVYVWNLTDAPNPMGFALRHPIEMLLKVFQVIRFTAGFCRPEAMWVLFFAIPAMLFFLPRIAMRNRLLAAIMLIVLPLFVTHTEARYFAPVLVPLVVLCLWVTEHKLRERTGAWPLAVFWTASVLVAFLLLNVSGLAGLRKHSYSRNWLRWDQVAFFENRTTPEHLIASDVPFAISWECNRTTTFLPFREGDLRAVDKVHPVDFVFVQQPRFNASLHDYEKSTWFQENFRILNIFDDDTGSRLYRRRTSILGGFDAPQLCQVRGNLFVLRERIVHSVDLPSLSRHPIQTVPEGVVRINGDETTGGFHLMSDDGTILGLAGAAGYNPEPPLEGVPIDFKFTPNGQGIFFLMDDGRVVPRGDAVDFGVRAGVIEQPLRLAVTSTGKGVLVLSADGTVVVCGDAKSGYERYFGEPLARDIALVPGTNDYYILDAFGSTHPSRTDSILAVGPYRADRRWALDLEILPGGAPYVLSDEGEILRYELKRADQVQATVP